MEILDIGAVKLGFPLSSGQLEQFNAYYQELIDWNKRVNLTRITDYEEVQLKHFLDSLTVVLALQALPPNGDLKLIDVGTGAGIPGLPLKIAFPQLKLALLDSAAKKAAFLHHISHKLGLDNVDIIVGRAEEISHQTQYREKFDIVLSRGVAPLATLAELTLPFCTIGGSFIAQKKGDTDTEVSQAMEAIGLLGGRLRGVKRVELEEFSDERQLVIIDKVSPTPPKYPRRPGMPRKRPLLAKQNKQE